MRMTPRPIFTASALLLALALPSLSAAEEYELLFDRPSEVGDRYTIAGEAYTSQTVRQRVNGQDQGEEESYSEINMEGTIEVLAINEDGGVSRLALTVGEYDIEINDEGVELQQDRRILAEVEGDEVVFQYENGNAIEDELAELFDMFLDDLIDDDGEGEDDDDILNIDGPKSPGDRWEMDHAIMIEDGRAEGGVVIDPDKIESEVHFVAVHGDTDFGEEMLELAMRAQVEDFRFGDGELPPGMALTESRMVMQGGGLIASDPGSSNMHHTMEMEMGFLAAGEPAEGVKVQVEFEAERGSELTIREAR